MNAQHTKGPWTVQRLSNGSTLVQLAEADIDVCQVFKPYPLKGKGPDNGERQEANARLIAAAPELLEALEACALFTDCVDAKHPAEFPRTIESLESLLRSIQNTARNAIAKAKGGM